MRVPAVLLAAAAWSVANGAFAQAGPTAPAAAAQCPSSATELPVTALYGDWKARIDGEAGAARVKLAAHPDYEGSVRGTIERQGGVRALLSGDIDDDGQLNLDESQDGRAINAIWLGDMQAASCGKEFTGTWRNAKDDSTHPFTLTRDGGRP